MRPILLIFICISLTFAQQHNPWATVGDQMDASNIETLITPAIENLERLIQQEKFALANDVLSRLPNLQGRDECYPAIHAARAEVLAHQNNLAEAVSEMQEAIACSANLGLESELGNNTVGQLHIRRADMLFDIPGRVDEGLNELGTAIDLVKRHGLKGHMVQYIGRRAHIYEQIHHRKKCVEDYRRITEIMPESVDAWLNLAQRDIADRSKAIESFKRAIEIDPFNSRVWHFMGHIEWVRGNMKEAELAFREALRINPAEELHIVYGKALIEAGRHKEAIERLKKCAFPRPQLSQIEGADCNHQLGVAYHALGQFRKSIEHLDTAMTLEPRRRQLNSWYQREYALYHHHSLDLPLSRVSLDQDMSSHWLDGWAKLSLNVVHHETFNGQQYKPQPPLNPFVDDVKNVKMDKIRESIEKYRHFYHLDSPGFVDNTRAQWMHALTVADVSQRIIEARKQPIQVRDGGASGGCSGGFDMHMVCNGTHEFWWRDAFDVAVKYRAVSGVTEAVQWCDAAMAHRSDQELSNSGYGETKLVDGDVTSHKYYTYFPRCFDRLKQEAIKFKPDDSDNSRAIEHAIMKAESIEDVIIALNMQSYQVEMSITDSSQKLPGTRLVIEPSKEERGYLMVIRTYRDRKRMSRYNDVMNKLWRSFLTSNGSECSVLAAKVYYIWVNMMPLNRGTAGVGMSMLQAMLLSCGAEITSRVPKLIQLDWEALLTEDSDAFAEYLLEAINVRITHAQPPVFVIFKRRFNTLRKLFTFLL